MNINYDNPFNFKPIPTITPASSYWQNGTWKFNMSEITAGGASQPSWIDVILKGNTALTLVNAKEDGLNYLKLFGGTELLPEQYLDTVTLSGGCEQRNLPSGFTQVEYLESSGTQYIDTGYKPNQNTYLKTSYVVSTNQSGANTAVLGCTKDPSPSIANYGMLRLIYPNRVGFGGNTGGSVVDISVGNTPSVLYELEYNKNVVTIKQGEQTLNVTTLPTGSSWAAPYNLYLFARNTAGSATFNISAKIYSTYITDGTTTLNLIPCRRNSDNVLGMYDTVTGNFLTNQGTGTFTAGADVTAPSPDYPMDIVSNNGVLKVSPNVLQGEWFLNQSRKSADGILYGLDNAVASDIFPVQSNTTYTVCYNGVANVARWYGYDANKSYITGSFITDSETITTSSDTKYISVSFTNSQLSGVVTQEKYKLCSVNKGDVALPFMPYGIYTDGTIETVTDSNQLTASAERLLAVGDYKDTQEVLSGSVTKRVGITILDGTESWNKSGTYAGSFYMNTYNPLDGAKVANNPNVYCSHGFKVNSLPEYASAPIGALYWYSSGTINYKYDDGTATVEQFKQWLTDQYNAGTPVIVVYPLATATTSTVSGQFLSKSPVTQTAGSISNLPIAITESAHTTPTPQQPLQINCNNGVIKVSPNLFDNGTFYNWYFTNGILTPNHSRYAKYMSISPNQTYTLSRNDNYAVPLRIVQTEVTPGDNVSYNIDGTSTFMQIESDQFPFAFTSRSSAKFLVFSTPADFTEEQAIDLFNKLQVELGSTDTSYRPYGAIYADGTQETVEIHSKNLFNYEYFYDNYKMYSPSSVGRCPIKLQPNTTYTVSTNTDRGSSSASIFVVSGSAIDWTPNTANNGVTSNSPRIVTTDSDGYLCLGIYVVSDSAIPESDFINGTVWVQIEQGSIATTYEPYTVLGTATAEMLLKVGTYQDVQSVLDGGVTRNVGIKPITGDMVSNYFTASHRCTIKTGDIIATQSPIMCTHFPIGTLGDYYVNHDSNNQYIYCYSKDCSSMDDYKNFFNYLYNSGNPVVVVYPLATPTTETVTAQPLSIQEGTNIVEITQASMDNLELEVSYKAGVAVTITEVENAQLDNNVEVTING